MSENASAKTPKTGTRADDRPKAGAKVAVNLVALVLLGVLAAVGTWSAFSALTTNSGNSFESGTVDLGDADGGNVMFTLTGLKPGDSATKCIVVALQRLTQRGVKLYGSTGGTGLDQYLTVKVTRGTKSNAFPSCTDFAADSRDYIGAGQGVVYNGTLENYPEFAHRRPRRPRRRRRPRDLDEPRVARLQARGDAAEPDAQRRRGQDGHSAVHVGSPE